MSAPTVEQYHASAIQNAYQSTQNTPPPITADDRIANYNLWLTVITGILAVIAMVQIWFLSRSDKTARIAADAARDAGNAAVESNKINRDAMIADQRPWVSVEIAITQPITWNENGANFQFHFTLENTGRTPALNAWVILRMIVNSNYDNSDEQKMMSEMAKKGKPFVGVTLFPGKPKVIGMGTNITNDELENSAKWWKDTYGIEFDGIRPALIGCVTYYTALDETPRQTGFIREIRCRVPIDNSVVIGRSVGDIPIDRLMLGTGMKEGITY